MGWREYRGILLVVGVISAMILGGFLLEIMSRSRVVLRVFNAGSLTLPLERVKARFERDFSIYRPPGSLIPYRVEVSLEPAGSVACIRKIIDVGRRADVLAVADYSLIKGMMMPNYTTWYLMFARNRMVIAYTNSSRYADEINKDNWYQILNRKGVRWGFSNPNLDPCGYRALMVIQLAELYYNDTKIFDDLVGFHSNIESIVESGLYRILCPEDIHLDTDDVIIRDKSVDLIALLESHGIDYAFEYLSVAVQHKLNYVTLPSQIDLSEITFEEAYRKVEVRLGGGKTVTGGAIIYGLTIPKDAPNRELAEQFVRYIVDEHGREVFREMGQPPIEPSLAYNLKDVPDILKPYCVEVEDGETE